LAAFAILVLVRLPQRRRVFVIREWRFGHHGLVYLCQSWSIIRLVRHAIAILINRMTITVASSVVVVVVVVILEAFRVCLRGCNRL